MPSRTDTPSPAAADPTSSQPAAALQAEYRKLPAVDALLRRADLLLIEAESGAGRALVVDTLRTLLAEARVAIAAGLPAPRDDWWPAALAARLDAEARPSLRRVINATGIIVHTNLGRAPLSRAALAAVQQAAQGYANLEYRLESGDRGSRHDHARTLLQQLTGAEDAMVVNNNAAAVYLMLAALCSEREVLISRGQLVEIGGGFRIPDVLRQSGAQLVEVGTTNRTHPRDFADAITPRTAAILRVHSSNFRQLGFVAMPSLEELATIAHAERPGQEPVLLLDDLGSGALGDTAHYGLAPEPTPAESLRAGSDLVAFSGDKLLGGPQAGLIVGRTALLERLRRHPLARALRVDKLTLAALDATLRAWAAGRAAHEIPVWRMIATPAAEILTRATAWQAALAPAGVAAEVWASESAVGGGSLPGETLPTWVLAVPAPAGQADGAAAHLRAAALPVVCRIQRDHLLFDPRTVAPDEEEPMLATLRATLKRGVEGDGNHGG
jgi:L-seryl-tRNA(Ser) seleniumtransferase